ncbi:DUF4062 domain-containing protein [Ideonella sp. 4Y16]|uniref:DUF4062 domain-containing protein n=1 Tax=Ideonella alba TaxID=2824118 RepID=UPI001B35ECA3|nr:DUF4062 domain-containing protein [Ideonella alba]MBQ0945536.1 DUF4062 domain-containing protein [Ideonella alba]
MKRPTFFISSTIYDFRDLRSSLKFYLEEQGCKVLASEFNDFRKPLDQHSYQACLQAIHAADYFVLLIGSRVGGWYDEPNRISITQREYREAYELHREGKLKLFSFVRSDVWQVKEERRELARYLDTVAIEDGLKRDISNFPSKSAADADFISSFLSEVGRNKETAAAVKTGSEAPTGNWINVFSDFRDLVRVIDGALFTSTPTEDLTLKRLLRRELREFLSQCLVKMKAGAVYSPRSAIDQFHRETPISLDGRRDSVKTVNTKTWDLLSSLSIALMGLQLHPVVLDRAVSVPTFLSFDLASDSYQETPVYEALLQLQDEVRRLKRANTTEVMSLVYEHSPKSQPHRGPTINIDTMKLAMFLHLMDRWANVIELSRAILQHLDGAPYRQPSLRPSSPIHGMEEQLVEQRPTNEEIDAFIRGGAQ